MQKYELKLCTVLLICTVALSYKAGELICKTFRAKYHAQRQSQTAGGEQSRKPRSILGIICKAPQLDQQMKAI